MAMTSYAVFDVDTGEVLHVHVEPAGLNSSPDEIIQLAGARGTRRLDVLQVPSEGLPKHPVKAVEGKLVPAGEGTGAGAAGAGGGLVEPEVSRRYERRGG
jgi:hypothetical protein